MFIDQWLARHAPAGSELIPASTVVLVRDGADGIETLMMRRNTRLDFAEGAWVFPGGRVDPHDLVGTSDPHDLVGTSDEQRAAVAAAVREAKEEADLDVDPLSCVHYAHWVPPVEAPKRYSTWFFLAPAPAGAVTVDLSEITDHAWWRPADALARAADARIEVLPPTWMTLLDLVQFATVADALAAVTARGPRGYATRIMRVDDETVSVWEGDVAYETLDPSATGPRHRLVLAPGGWRFELG